MTSSLAVKRHNRIVIPGKDQNTAIVHRHSARSIIRRIVGCDFRQQSEVQTAVLSLLLFDAREVYVLAVGEEEEERAGAGVGCGGGDVEIEECGVDWGDGGVELVSERVVGALGGGRHDEVGELEYAGRYVGWASCCGSCRCAGGRGAACG